jgi:small-conductance mechanosensitive channel
VSEGPSDNATEDHIGRSRDRVLLDVGLYAVARLLLVVVLTGAIYLAARLLGLTEFPVVVAALFALIIAMPLGIWLFGRLRRRATAALSIAAERRRAEREQLQARLRGESVDDEQEPGPDNEPEPGPDGQ